MDACAHEAHAHDNKQHMHILDVHASKVIEGLFPLCNLHGRHMSERSVRIISHVVSSDVRAQKLIKDMVIVPEPYVRATRVRVPVAECLKFIELAEVENFIFRCFQRKKVHPAVPWLSE